jgi:spore coat protein U-like protein
MLKKSPFLKSALAVAVIALATSAQIGSAATATATFTVIATVAASCTVSAASLAFGNYVRADLDGTTTVTVNCNSGTIYDGGLNASATAGSTVATCIMKSGTNSLNYTLYTNSGRTTVWGNTVGTDTVAGTGNGTDQPLIVYGRVLDGQQAPSGSYTDSVTATITH